MRTFVTRAGLFVFGFLVTIAVVTLLTMAARSQLRFQYPPEDLRYAPARPVPPVQNRAPRPSDISDFEEEDVPNAAAPAYTPSISPGYAPGYAPSYAPSYAPPAAAGSEPRPAPAPQPAPREPAADAVEPPRPTAPTPRPKAAPAPAPKAGGFRRVGGKTFKQAEDGFFVDTAYRADSKLQVVEVKAGSPEYTRLVELHRELAPYFRLADRLVVVFDGVVYRVVP
jgi:hypothetical protein